MKRMTWEEFKDKALQLHREEAKAQGAGVNYDDPYPWNTKLRKLVWAYLNGCPEDNDRRCLDCAEALRRLHQILKAGCWPDAGWWFASGSDPNRTLKKVEDLYHKEALSDLVPEIRKFKKTWGTFKDRLIELYSHRATMDDPTFNLKLKKLAKGYELAWVFPGSALYHNLQYETLKLDRFRKYRHGDSIPNWTVDQLKEVFTSMESLDYEICVHFANSYLMPFLDEAILIVEKEQAHDQ